MCSTCSSNICNKWNMCIVHFLNNSKSQSDRIESTLLNYLSHLHVGFLLALLASARHHFEIGVIRDITPK